MIGAAIANDGTPINPGAPIVLTGDRSWEFAFVPSARAMQIDIPAQNVIHGGDNSRRHTETFCVGYKERVTLETGTAANWLWRRIVVNIKSLECAQSFPQGALYNNFDTTVPNPGYLRTLFDYSTNDLARQTLYRELFQGTLGIDYQDIFNAPIDTRRVDKVYDRVISVGSGNNAAHWKRSRFWHPVRKRLVYNEKESGDHKDTQSEASHYNNGAKFGCGDLWVIDMFACANGAASDVMNFLPQGTYYWHER